MQEVWSSNLHRSTFSFFISHLFRWCCFCFIRRVFNTYIRYFIEDDGNEWICHRSFKLSTSKSPSQTVIAAPQEHLYRKFLLGTLMIPVARWTSLDQVGGLDPFAYLAVPWTRNEEREAVALYHKMSATVDAEVHAVLARTILPGSRAKVIAKTGKGSGRQHEKLAILLRQEEKMLRQQEASRKRKTQELDQVLALGSSRHSSKNAKTTMEEPSIPDPPAQRQAVSSMKDKLPRKAMHRMDLTTDTTIALPKPRKMRRFP